MSVTAIVVAGAGARGAYEAGILSELVPHLRARPVRVGEEDRIVVIGTSAGAINAAVLAAFADPEEATATAIDLWTSVRSSEIFSGILVTAVQSAVSYVGQLVGGPTRIRSLLDSSPLRRLIEERLDWRQLHRNLATRAGWVDTAGIVTTACGTGRTTVFLEGRGGGAPPPDDRRSIDYRTARLDASHVLASSAIPVVFRPVHVEQPAAAAGWHIDGGLRLNAPIKPALALGADRIVVVASTPDPDTAPARLPPLAEPDVFDGAGAILSSLLEDRMSEDLRSLRRTNRLVGTAAAGRRQRDPDDGGGSVVPHLFLGPPDADVIPALAREVLAQRYGGRRQLSNLGLLGRLIGGSRGTHGELLSFLLFDPDFHAELVELGRHHARAALGPDTGVLPWRDACPSSGSGEHLALARPA